MLDLMNEIQHALTDDLRKPKYRSNPNPMAGHCYVATEALYHLLSKKQRKTWKPKQMWHEGESHWFLANINWKFKVDLTASQFKTKPPYHTAKGRGFLTKRASKRARVLIRRVRAALKAKEASI